MSLSTTGCAHLIASGLEDVVVVAYDEGNGGELVERVAGEVDLACLAVGKSDAVVDNGGVAGSDAAHGNRLHPPCPTVVAEGDARHVAEGIGHGMDAKPKHALAVDPLTGRRPEQELPAARQRHRRAANPEPIVAYCRSGPT